MTNDGQRSEVEECVQLLGYDPVAHQATGMAAVQTGSSMLDAARLLIAKAEETAREVVAVAEDVVNRRLTFARD